MTSKRHAELQRKLTLAQVPKPPADLLDRIKNDIPEYLRPEAERARLRRALSFNLRVAAAFLVVISSVVATMYLLEPQEELSRIAAKAPAPAATATMAAPRTAATDQVRVEISQEAPARVMQVANVETATADSPAAAALRRDELRRQEDTSASYDVAGRTADAVSGGAEGGTAAPVMSVAELAAPPAAPVPPPPAPAAPPAAEPAPQTITITQHAPTVQPRPAAKLTTGSLVPEARADGLDLGPRASVFGISLDPTVFHRIKETLEKNQRPGASAINVEAIINYFAGGPARKLRRGVKLEVEGSPSPVDKAGQHGFLRFTIDTASADSNLPVAADAKLEIDLNGKVVEKAEPVGDSTVTGPESALLHNLSVTGLYELTLRENLRASDRVATVRLSYNEVATGKRRVLEQTVYARDFAKLWTRASRRHRLASLGAVWGQSLKASSPAPEVARRAEELATQEPRDARAKELATAATASEKLNSGF